MSMSQEEIEALMNGLDISDEEPQEEVSQKVNTDEIEQLLSQKETIKSDFNVDENDEAEEGDSNFDLDELLAEESSSDNSLIDNDEIDELLKDIENTPSFDEEDNLEESKIEETVVEKPKVKTEPKKEELPFDTEEMVKNWTSSKIDEGIFPLPADKDAKVVNQLSQVANDSEEKVSQIFDVLSLTLDNNGKIRKSLKEFDAYFEKQNKLLNTLNQKFPNISLFDEHLTLTNNVSRNISDLKSLMDDEDNNIFQAMELMQFNDINRQKIERVMSVIRKLSLYLNNLFEDDQSHKEIAVAKHIHGDENNDLIGEDLDKLIAEFNKDN